MSRVDRIRMMSNRDLLNKVRGYGGFRGILIKEGDIKEKDFTQQGWRLSKDSIYLSPYLCLITEYCRLHNIVLTLLTFARTPFFPHPERSFPTKAQLQQQ